MNEDVIEERLESLLQAAEHEAKVGFRDVTAAMAARGAYQSSAMLLQKIAKLGDAFDSFVEAALQDVPSVEARGGDSTVLYEALTTKLIQLKLRGTDEIMRKSDWAGPSANAAMKSEIERRLNSARAKVRHHQLGFDRPPAPSAGVSVSGSQNVIVQSQSPNANANLTVNIATVRHATEQLERAIPWDALPVEEASELRAEIDTIKAQLQKATPSAFILRESGRTLRSLVENIAASAASPPIIAAAIELWKAVGLG